MQKIDMTLKRATSLLMIVLAVGTACSLFSREAGSQTIYFTVENRQASQFAAWAATPGVRVITGDFNNDNRTDIALVRQTPGWTSVPVALSTEGGFIVQNRQAPQFAAWAATPGVRVITGDFGGDFLTDIALVRQTTGWASVPVALSTEGGFIVQNRQAPQFAAWAATPGVRVITGYFNDESWNRKTDIALVRQEPGWASVPVAVSTATGFVAQNPQAPQFAAWAATPGVTVITGDFNEDESLDQRTDIALVRQTTGWTSVPVALSTDPPPPPPPKLAIDNISCDSGSSRFRCEATVSGGTPPYSYQWHPGGDITSWQGINQATFTGTCTLNRSIAVSLEVTDSRQSRTSMTRSFYCS